MNNRGDDFGNSQPSSNWSDQGSQGFGMWDPNSVQHQAPQSNTSDWRTAPIPRDNMSHLYQGQGDMNSDWRVGSANTSQPNAVPPYSGSSAPLQNFHQPVDNFDSGLRSSPNTYGQYSTPGLQNVQDSSYWQQQQTYNGGQSEASNAALYYSSVPQYNDWSSLTSESYSNPIPNERSYASGGSGNFKNPLMNSNSDNVSETENLIKNMHIQGQKAKMEMQNKNAGPLYFSKASLAMLKQDLDQAAVSFESPEALRKARERELGLYSLDGVGTEVIVSDLSANAASFVPRSKSAAADLKVLAMASEEEEQTIMASLTTLVKTVLPQPGSFDNLSAVFVNQVRAYKHSDETVQKMVDLIFNKAISENRFQYHGAKLCDMLTTPDVLTNFRTIFLNHFQKEFATIRSLFETAMEDNIDKIHGFFNLMAEVFIHIKINGQPIISLGKSFARSLEKLMSEPTIKNVNFVCKMLKLTGAKLRDALEKDNAEIYQKVFIALKAFSDKHADTNDEKIKKLLPLIESVSRLKEINWGRTNSNTRRKSSINDPEQYGDELSEIDQNYYMNEPVFFTPDGVQYTAAEAQIPEFYDQHLAKFNLKAEAVSEDTTTFPWNPNDNYFDDFVPSDEEVELYKNSPADDELDEEYEKFLADSGQLL